MDGYQVVWNGTRASASGTPYLATDEVPSAPPAPRPVVRVTARIAAHLAAQGPSTVREIAEALGESLFRINSSICNMRKLGKVVSMGHRRVVVRQFGVRLVAVYGVPA